MRIQLIQPIDKSLQIMQYDVTDAPNRVADLGETNDIPGATDLNILTASS
jgi:hypothetical protein